MSNPSILIRFPKETIDYLKKQSEAKGISPQEYIRNLIMQDKRRNNNPFTRNLIQKGSNE